MRRTTLLVVAALTLAAVSTAPAATAAPVKNVWTYDVGCDFGDGEEEFTVKAVGVPGWMVADDSLAQVPSLMMGGHIIFTDATGEYEFHDPVPPGLMGMLTVCWVAGPTDAYAPFHILIDPAYIFWLPAQA